MTLTNGNYQREVIKQDALPAKAMNFARRMNKLAAESQRGRIRFELLVTKHGRWILCIEDGLPEDLGE